MIRARDVSFAYPGAEQVLKQASLEAVDGGLCLLAGPNGSGKSTLLCLLAGLFRPASGAVELDGAPADEAALRRTARLVTQDADLQILGGTVEEDLLLGRDADDAGVVEAARDAAARFGLLDAWETPVQTLSWGQKRKLCLAAVLIEEPKVLLLDEPFSGLDHPAVLEMRRLLAAHRDRGLTQVLALHDLEPALDLAQRVVVLHRGETVLSGAPEDVLGDVERFGVRRPCSWRLGLGIAPYADGDDAA